MQQRRVILNSMTNPESNNLGRFSAGDSHGIKISPQTTLVISVAFIVAVFILHILGKIVGFATGGSQQPPAPSAAP